MTRTSLPSAGISRRQALMRGALAAAGLTLGPVLCGATRTPAGRGATGRGRPAAAAKPAASHTPAKAVIQVWMWGGPAHLDTFDPKPDAGRDYCGPLGKPIATNVDGVRIGELLPLLARQADKYAIIRSLTHGNNGHETAAYMVQTGRQPGRTVYPCVGAVVALHKGYEQGYQGVVPPYVVLTETQGRFSEAGFLGQRYKPFATGGDPNQAPFAVEGIVARGITDERQRARRDLLHSLDTLGQAMPAHPGLAALDDCEKQAYEMVFGEARRLFDLGQEPADLRDRYGRHTFGQSCLMARRLVESGVPYVTINYKGWDTHKQHFETMRRRLPELDQGLATLLQDLADRGLLDSTIVWWSGEFGRTPKVDWQPPWNGGRGHYGKCFSGLLAGGGFRTGCVVGASDARGETVADRPVYPVDLVGAIYERLGVPLDGPLDNPAGITAQVLPTPGPEQPSGGRLSEIL